MKLALDIWYEFWEKAGSRERRNGREQEDPVTRIEASQSKRTAQRAPRRPPDLPLVYWLIAKNENGRLEEVLTLDRDGEEMLPVFSFEEEAKMFLWFRGVGEDWLVNKSGSGELVSVLYGPCAGVKEVALDPLPEMVVERTVSLVSLDRERFIERITARKKHFEPGEPGRGSSQPREGGRSRKSEEERIVTQYSARPLA